MSSFLTDSLARGEQKEFARFYKTRRRGLLGTIAFFISSFIIGGIFLYSLSSVDELQPTALLGPGLSNSSMVRLNEFVDTQSRYRSWLERYVSSLEVSAYMRFSDFALKGVTTILKSEKSGAELGFVSKGYLLMYKSILRIAFFLIASWRLWLGVLVLALAWGYMSWRPYVGLDLLGQLGRDVLFFSGVRIDLGTIDSSGVPNLQVAGLVNTKKASSVEVAKSNLRKILCDHAADNKTNLALVAIILGNKNYPGFAYNLQGSKKRSQTPNFGLVETTETMLEVALKLQSEFKGPTYQSEEGIALDRLMLRQFLIKPFSLGVYKNVLSAALERTLTYAKAKRLSRIPARNLATLVLSLQAGKVLAYQERAGAWLQVSNYPHLSARAVLHSIAEYSRDYSVEERTNIRRALIYAMRRSAFGPVRFSTDLSEDSRALRQWSEILLSHPYSLVQVTDEVELFGQMDEVFRNWTERFLSFLPKGVEALSKRAFVLPYSLVFLPVGLLVQIYRELLDDGKKQRLEELIRRVSKRQRMERKIGSVDASERQITRKYSFDIVLLPLSNSEVKKIARREKILPGVVKDWSSLRVILNYFGWLGRRVGDRKVSKEAVFSARLDLDQRFSGEDALESKQEVSGFTSLRTSRIRQRLGKEFLDQFVFVTQAELVELPKESTTGKVHHLNTGKHRAK